ncbi:hypothetical protein GCM10009662_21150 [Catellatospora coxensis]|uniref:Uncharacterized protein n=1 Tax=Catellatospora coxensis TaxID=310354 RepID=A0A8J3L0P5_9ACTN|nr:hypothetical protein Cco03nite_57740 [Catellatospora coxensis]
MDNQQRVRRAAFGRLPNLRGGQPRRLVQPQLDEAAGLLTQGGSGAVMTYLRNG